MDPPDQIGAEQTADLVLPQVLEEVLALKNQRAIELGTEDAEAPPDKQQPPQVVEQEHLWEKDDNLVEAEPTKEKQKDGLKVNKKKKKKKKRRNQENQHKVNRVEEEKIHEEKGEIDPDVDVE